MEKETSKTEINTISTPLFALPQYTSSLKKSIKFLKNLAIIGTEKFLTDTQHLYHVFKSCM